MKPTNFYNLTSLAVVYSFAQSCKLLDRWPSLLSHGGVVRLQPSQLSTFTSMTYFILQVKSDVCHDASQIHYFLRTMYIQQPSHVQMGGDPWIGASNMSRKLCLSRSNSLIPQSQGDIRWGGAGDKMSKR